MRLNTSLAYRIFSAVLVVPDLIAIPLLYRVTAEYSVGSRMRHAWTLMIWSAGFSAVRHLVDFSSSFAGAEQGTITRNIFLIPMLLSVSALLLSMTLLWLSFRGLGLQRPFTWPNRFVVLIVALFAGFCLFQYSSFPQSTASFPFFRYLERLNPLVFVTSTVVGLLLYRLSQDIGASDLGLSILFLVLQLVARIAGFAVQTLERRFHMPQLANISNCFYWIAPWLFLWAVLLRWQIIGNALLSAQCNDEPIRDTKV